MRSCAILLVAVSLHATTLRAESETSTARIENLVVKLDDDVYQVRESAQQELVKLGEPAIAAVGKAMTSESAEVRFRARAILRHIVARGRVLHLSMERHPGTLTRHGDVKSVQDRDGNKDHAVQFQSGGYLVVSDADTLDTDEQFTLAAWLKPSKFVDVRPAGIEDHGDKPIYPWGKGTAHWDGHYIVAKWFSEAIHGDYLFALTPSGQLGLGVADYRAGYHWDALHTKRPLKVDKWVHVAATFDRGEMQLYVGAKVEATKRSAEVRQTSIREYGKDDVYIGALWNDRYNFRGAIDEVCIYNRALSQQEIEALMMLTK